MAKLWKKGRGKLGFLDPILGTWVAEANSPMGPVRCIRILQRVLDDNYVRLEALWQFGPGAKAPLSEVNDATFLGAKGYKEIAIIGVGDDKNVGFWSFTSDGKRSQGTVCDATDVHEEAIGFEAQMPAGLARMIYWPDEDGGFRWAVESKNKKGWKRFTEHRYLELKN